MSEELLFEGLKVLDVGTWIAAPTVGSMLADLGADVTKIEQPEVGDAYRIYYTLPVSPESKVNYTFTLDSHNKRSLTLNLKSAEGKAIAKALEGASRKEQYAAVLALANEAGQPAWRCDEMTQQRAAAQAQYDKLVKTDPKKAEVLKTDIENYTETMGKMCQ